MSGQGVSAGVKGFTDNKAEEKRRIPKREKVSEAEKREFIEEQKRVAEMLQVFPRNLPDALDTVMKEYHIQEKDLAKDCDLDKKTLERMRTNIDYKPTLPTMIQLCIGLRVPAVISLELIHVSGFTLKLYGVEFAYYCIITQKVGCTLHVCNEFLTGMGYSPLGRTEKAA